MYVLAWPVPYYSWPSWSAGHDFNVIRSLGGGEEGRTSWEYWSGVLWHCIQGESSQCNQYIKSSSPSLRWAGNGSNWSCHIDPIPCEMCQGATAVVSVFPSHSTVRSDSMHAISFIWHRRNRGGSLNVSTSELCSRRKNHLPIPIHPPFTPSIPQQPQLSFPYVPGYHSDAYLRRPNCERGKMVVDLMHCKGLEPFIKFPQWK